MGKRRQKENKKREQKQNKNCNRTGTTSGSDASKPTMYPTLEENIDHISNLPDEILYQILALLPTESALQTSFLSTRWKALWNIALVQHGTLKDIASAVDGFLSRVKGVINPLRDPRTLQFHFNQASLLLANVSVNKKLHLDFSTGRQEYPRQFGWNLQQSVLNNPYTFVKILHLTSVSYLTSDAVSSIVSEFQLLEHLKISKCNGLRSLRIGSSWNLRVLTVLDCSQLKYLHVIAPTILSFQYRGPLPWFSPYNFWRLEDAMCDFREGPGYNGFKNSDLNYLISPVYKARILTLCKWTFEAMISHQPSIIGNGIAKFYYLRELWWIDSSIQEDNVQALLSFLYLCVSLERLFIHIDPTSYSIPSTVKSTNQVASQTQLGHLKVVKFEGFMSQEDEILLAARLLEVITTMPLIIATTHGNRPRRLVRMSSYKTKQLNKMGDKKVVEPRGRKYSYRFVDELQDIDELCSKHAHMSL